MASYQIDLPASTVSIPPGASSSANQLLEIAELTSINGKLGGRAIANAPARNDYTSTAITTAAYQQIVASTTSATTAIEIFDSSGQTLYLAVGGVGSEVNQVLIVPGGNKIIPLLIPAGSRVSVKAVSADATTGELNINFYA